MATLWSCFSIQQKITFFPQLPQNLTSNESSLVKCKMFAYITIPEERQIRHLHSNETINQDFLARFKSFRTSKTIKIICDCHFSKLKRNSFVVKRKMIESLFFRGDWGSRKDNGQLHKLAKTHTATKARSCQLCYTCCDMYCARAIVIENKLLPPEVSIVFFLESFHSSKVFLSKEQTKRNFYNIQPCFDHINISHADVGKPCFENYPD